MAIDYSQRIPNNVDLSSDRRLQRALENWQPRFLDWWKDMGPDGIANFDVYLRTAISADANGWANFGYVKMPDYRWGIFLAEPGSRPHDRLRRQHGQAGVAGSAGRVALDPAPPDRDPRRHRARLGRAAAPARQDRALALRPAQPLPGQLSRKAAICGPWSTCCTPISAATAARRRRSCWSAIRAIPTSRASWAPSTSRRRTGSPSSCSPTSPTATASTSSQSLAESGFDPLARTCRFMLTEEAHHMFVGETGVRPHRPAHLRADEASTRPTTCAASAPSTCRPCRSTSTSTSRCRSTCSARRPRPTPPTTTRWASRAVTSRRASRTTIC